MYVPEHKLNGRPSLDDLLIRRPALAKPADLSHLLQPVRPSKQRSIADDVLNESGDEAGRVSFSEDVAIAENKFLQFWRHFGIMMDRSTSGQLIGMCPKCGKQKLYANAANGLWDCKVCVTSGNIYDFLAWFNDILYHSTTEDQYGELAKLRKYSISVEVLREKRLVFNGLTQEWMIPAYSMQDSIVNLYAWRIDKDSKKRQLRCAPIVHQSLYLINELGSHVDRPIWIMEGHWDALAAVTLHRRCGIDQKNYVVGLAGSTGYPRYVVNQLNGRIVFSFVDNDEAGEQHQTNLTNLLASTSTAPSEYKRIHWKKGLPDGYDFSDLCAGREAAIIKDVLERRKKKE